jgi:CMP-N-acetylneuraminic acid synthetase
MTNRVAKNNKPKVLAIIPARGGSKGLSGKNIRNLAGQPLINWTIKTALRCEGISRVIVSTDDPKIAEISKEAGADIPFMRPADLASDSAPGMAPVLHALGNLEPFDYVVLLQPTSPLRSVGDVDQAINRCVEGNARACVSVSPASSHPYLCYSMDKSGLMTTELPERFRSSRRQEFPDFYSLNGAIYVGDVSYVLTHQSFMGPETVGYVMPKERSIDIDDIFDFEVADFLMRRAEDSSS